MATYLVELYLPKRAADDIQSTTKRAQEAAEKLSQHGDEVRCLRSIYVAEDETWFGVYEASSAAVVVRAVEHAKLRCGRIVSALTVD